MINKLKRTKITKRRRRFRSKKNIVGTSKKPRLCVYRSNRYVYAQIINDAKQETICQSSSLKNKKEFNMEVAKNVGNEIGKLAMDKGINQVVFDRNGYKYHGKVKALAEGAREAGLKF